MSVNGIEAISEVRRRTLAPIWACKKTLEAHGWDVEKSCSAISKTIHENKNDNAHDSYGSVGLYSHSFGRVGVLVEVSCESSYVVKSREFVRLVNAIASHIAWSNPIALDRSDSSLGIEGVCLLDQPEMKETQGQITIGELVAELSMKSGEDIRIVAFARFEVGKQPRFCRANLPTIFEDAE